MPGMRTGTLGASRYVQAAALALTLVFTCGCERGRDGLVHRFERAMPIEVRADSAARLSMPAAPAPGRVLARATAPPRASLTLTHVAGSRAALQAALPEPVPAEPPVPAPPPDEEVPADDALHAPVPLAPARLHLAGAGAGVVDIDMHVDESGEVGEVRVAFSVGAAALVSAAIDAASEMRFRPATRRGKPVAVWCRQRFAIAP